MMVHWNSERDIRVSTLALVTSSPLHGSLDRGEGIGFEESLINCTREGTYRAEQYVPSSSPTSKTGELIRIVGCFLYAIALGVALLSKSGLLIPCIAAGTGIAFTVIGDIRVKKSLV